MRIRLDENLSPRVATAVQAIAGNRSGFDVSHNRDGYAGVADPLWLKSFASADGDVVVSGDANILQNWPDLIAYHESGLVAFFPSPAFQRFKGYARAAFILRWWPAIIEKAKESEAGDCWRLPMQWTPDLRSFQRLKDPRLANNETLIEASERGSRTKHPFSRASRCDT